MKRYRTPIPPRPKMDPIYMMTRSWGPRKPRQPVRYQYIAGRFPRRTVVIHDSRRKKSFWPSKAKKMRRNPFRSY